MTNEEVAILELLLEEHSDPKVRAALKKAIEELQGRASAKTVLRIG
jgi:hypothetical protein